MSENKLQIRITKDANGNDIELDSMSLAATKSFVALLESLTKIIELTPNNEGIKIQVIKGSATAIAIGSNAQMKSISDD